jgi:predicted small secreted protein
MKGEIMKKLLLVLMVVALAAFLLVGCIPSTPAEGEGEGEGVVEICPTVAVTSQVAVGGKNYIKAGSQTITVTFAVPTEPVSVYVGDLLKAAPLATSEVVMYANAAKTVYTGTVLFAGSCDEAYIYVETCDACAYCKYPYTVDNTGPASEIKISKSACVCAGCTIEFDSTAASTTCAVTTPCCGDACSGFASYAIDLYASKPFDTCCAVPCVTPAYSCPGGVACPVDCTLTCITGGATSDKVYYAVVTLLDKVGNKNRYYATLTLDSACGLTVQEYTANVQSGLCSDYTVTHGSAQVVTTLDPAEIGDCLTTGI